MTDWLLWPLVPVACCAGVGVVVAEYAFWGCWGWRQWLRFLLTWRLP